MDSRYTAKMFLIIKNTQPPDGRVAMVLVASGAGSHEQQSPSQCGSPHQSSFRKSTTSGHRTGISKRSCRHSTKLLRGRMRQACGIRPVFSVPAWRRRKGSASPVYVRP